MQDYRAGFVDGLLFAALILITATTLAWLLEPRPVAVRFVPVTKPTDAKPDEEKAE
jgi:hypothetical protein